MRELYINEGISIEEKGLLGLRDVGLNFNTDIQMP